MFKPRAVQPVNARHEYAPYQARSPPLKPSSHDFQRKLVWLDVFKCGGKVVCYLLDF